MNPIDNYEQMDAYVNMVKFGNKKLRKFLRKYQVSSEILNKGHVDLIRDLLDWYEALIYHDQCDIFWSKESCQCQRSYDQCNKMIIVAIKNAMKEVK